MNDNEKHSNFWRVSAERNTASAYDDLPSDCEPNFHGDFSDMSEEAQDAIINPKHYQIMPGIEYFDIMEYALKEHDGVVGHALGQIFKYSFRLGAKDDIVQDAKKIEWYASRLREYLENGPKIK
ncbi:DUF3310 domain-containing protein [Alphaproteobacteria bacterium]|nr:DUF3310 domain-containing protein [Alphaproteobacteria bacterium]